MAAIQDLFIIGAGVFFYCFLWKTGKMMDIKDVLSAKSVRFFVHFVPFSALFALCGSDPQGSWHTASTIFRLLVQGKALDFIAAASIWYIICVALSLPVFMLTGLGFFAVCIMLGIDVDQERR